MIRTKIVATIGPATSDAPTLLKLLRAGADVVRLNFSHGHLDDHTRMLGAIGEAAAQYGQSVAILGDLGGPKIRLGKVADVDGAAGMPIAPGQILTLQRQPIEGRDLRVSSTYEKLVDDVAVGDAILVEDGMLRFVVRDKRADDVACECIVGGVLKSAKGINLPDTSVSVPSITPRDWECVAWAIEHNLDYLALSFVRRDEEVRQLRAYLRDRQSGIHIISKIEKPQAIDHLDAILEASDGLMVARGDLGVEMDVARVPIIQKDLVRRCRMAGKPVIVATQMLQSMIEQATPTRAEVSDVANAIFDRTDAVMLSGETSVGRFPAQAVGVMNHVAQVTEEYLARHLPPSHPLLRSRAMEMSAAMAHGVWEIVQHMTVKAVVVWSRTGQTARLFSTCRLSMPLVALSDDERTLRQATLRYGTVAVRMDRPSRIADLMAGADRIVQERGLAQRDDSIIVIPGSALAMPGDTNGIILHRVGEGWAR
jgi:pyruvate kinase